MKKMLKIMIAEENFICSSLMCYYMKRLGFDNCYIAGTVSQAVKMAHENKMDVVFIDIVFDGKINGIEAAKKIIDKNSNAVIVFLTSCDDCQVMEEAMKILPAAYLIKPVLFNKVKEVLDIIVESFSTAIYFNRKYRMIEV